MSPHPCLVGARNACHLHSISVRHWRRIQPVPSQLAAPSPLLRAPPQVTKCSLRNQQLQTMKGTSCEAKRNGQSELEDSSTQLRQRNCVTSTWSKGLGKCQHSSWGRLITYQMICAGALHVSSRVQAAVRSCASHGYHMNKNANLDIPGVQSWMHTIVGIAPHKCSTTQC